MLLLLLLLLEGGKPCRRRRHNGTATIGHDEASAPASATAATAPTKCPDHAADEWFPIPAHQRHLTADEQRG